jgi:hypothetical protein|eukprot:COSAG06_NODE_1132_length_10582_cov_5.539826_3_plen_85_part_00
MSAPPVVGFSLNRWTQTRTKARMSAQMRTWDTIWFSRMVGRLPVAAEAAAEAEVTRRLRPKRGTMHRYECGSRLFLFSDRCAPP